MKRNIVATLVMVLTTLSCTVAAADVAPEQKRWGDTIREFEKWDSKNYYPIDGVLFVGSSSIRMWPTREYFPDLPVINRGFGGSQISDVNFFADRIVLPYKPQLIVFYCGDNDIAAGKSPTRILQDYKAFVALVCSELPSTKIIFIAIKPSGSRWDKWPLMKETNSSIEAFSKKDKKLYYFDAASPLLGKDGKPMDKLFLKDRLHLNPEGYTAWTKHLRPLIDKAFDKSEQKKSRH